MQMYVEFVLYIPDMISTETKQIDCLDKLQEWLKEGV